MKRYIGFTKSRIERIPTDEGQSIEEKVRQALANNEPIESISPMIWTEEKDGVLPQYDPRTDKFDLALEAVDKYNASETAQNMPKAETKNEPKNESTNETNTSNT